jgi:uncharacterized protein involved in type VI secretion and phage assembly
MITRDGTPNNATVSTLKSQSSKGGSTSTSNELRFEDKMGSEHVWLQAEKDFLRNVKNDSSHSVGNDEFVTIKNDQPVAPAAPAAPKDFKDPLASHEPLDQLAGAAVHGMDRGQH